MKYLLFENQLESHVRVRKWFYRVAFWIFATVLLFALVRNANWSLTFSRLSDISLSTLLACAGVWTLSFVFRALRFQSEWKKFGKIPFLRALRATVLHNAAVVLVPFRVGELGYPVLVRELIQVTWQQCIRSLLWLRFQDAIVLLLMAFLIFPVMNIELRILTLCVAGCVLIATRKWWIRILRSRHFLAGQLRAFLHQRSDALGWFWSLANWTSKLSVVSLLLFSLLNVDAYQILCGSITGELSALLPLTGPAGFGTYEAGVWLGLGLPWSQLSQVMSSILLTHVFFLMISLALAFLFLIVDGFNNLTLKSQQSSANA
jgi:uncharacterized membrane protein YbhN (UPF0104 family)